MNFDGQLKFIQESCILLSVDELTIIVQSTIKALVFHIGHKSKIGLWCAHLHFAILAFPMLKVILSCKTKMGDSDFSVGVMPGVDSNFCEFGVGVGTGVKHFL